MKYLVFKRESNKFDDILKDSNIKKVCKTQLRFTNHLILGVEGESKDAEKMTSYIVLKYGDDIVSMDMLVKDRTPIPHKDYTPIRKNRNNG